MYLSIQQVAVITGQSEDEIKVERAAHAATDQWEAGQLQVLEQATGSAAAVDYGSPQWVQLPIQDPRRAQALIQAARAWRILRADLPEQVLRQVTLDASQDSADRERHFAEWEAREQEEWHLIVQDIRAWANHPTAVEKAALLAAEQRKAARPVVATTGWPPVAIPGRPGWHRQLINGQQVDTPARQSREAA